MTGMIATPNEVHRITDNIGNLPSLLAIVMAMVNLRFVQAAEAGNVTAEVQKKFLYKIEMVGEGIHALQNCQTRPALSLGYAHIADQMAIIKLPVNVQELFEIAGIDQEIDVPHPKSATFLIPNKKNVDDFILRTGISLNFGSQVA